MSDVKTYISSPNFRGLFGTFRIKGKVKNFKFIASEKSNDAIFPLKVGSTGGHGILVTDDSDIQKYIEAMDIFGTEVMLKGAKLPKYSPKVPSFEYFDDPSKQAIVEEYNKKMAQQGTPAKVEEDLKGKILRFGVLQGKLLKQDGTYNQKNIDLVPEYEKLKEELKDVL